MPKDFTKNSKCNIGNTKNAKIINEFIKLIRHVTYEMDNEQDKKAIAVHGHRLRQIKNALNIIQN